MTTEKKSPPLLWLYIFSGVAILGLIVWTSLRTLRDNPNREATVDLPGQGLVTVRFTTDPYPPLPSGTVILDFMAINSRRQMLNLGPALPYSYGSKGSETPIAAGQAILDEMGMSYQAGVQFSVVGDYWTILELDNGKQVRFQFYVEPAQ
ncbi:MAG TPA: hypothetical protein VFZ76_03675 [Anaerolineales bacterium]